MQKAWNVYVYRDGRSRYVGEVHERTEALARCAALSRFGVSDDGAEAGEGGPSDEAIHPDDEFELSPRTCRGRCGGGGMPA